MIRASSQALCSMNTKYEFDSLVNNAEWKFHIKLPHPPTNKTNTLLISNKPRNVLFQDMYVPLLERVIDQHSHSHVNLAIKSGFRSVHTPELPSNNLRGFPLVLYTYTTCSHPCLSPQSCIHYRHTHTRHDAVG